MGDKFSTKDSGAAAKSSGKGTRRGKNTRRSGKGSNRNSYTSNSNNNAIPNSNSKSTTSQLVIDAATMGYGFPAGTPIRNVGLRGTDYEPGNIMVLRVMPVIGNTEDALSPINTAMRSFYSYVNYANSRNASYEDTDLMLYMLAMDSAYAWYYHLIRVYGVARLYSGYNRNLPLRLLDGMQIDKSIIDNLADFRAYINTYAWRLGSFFVPDVFPYLTRHAQMYSNVYVDDLSKKGAMYAYIPDGVYMYEEMSEQPGHLKYIKLEGTTTYAPGYKLKFSDLTKIGNDMLNKLQLSQDVGIIGSDILRAFGQEGLIKIPMVNEDYVVEPIFDADVLVRIHNSVIMDGVNDGTDTVSDIVQEGQYLKQVLQINPRVGTYYDRPDILLDSPFDQPTPEDTRSATRHMVLCDGSYVTDCGTELIVGAKVLTSQEEYSFTSVLIIDVSKMGAQIIADLAREVQTINLLSNFNYHPAVLTGVFHNGSGDGWSKMSCSINSNVVNYVALPKADLANIHRADILEMFSVPQYGAYKGKATQ